MRKMQPELRLNIGCGHNHLPGFVNVDKSPACNPDVVFNAETQPWPWESDSAAEVVFQHSLEHMGADAGVFLGLMCELYRICGPGALVRITVPHPRHDTFINDPTHVRIVTPNLLCLFDREKNKQCIASGFANTPLAIYVGVDFVLESYNIVLAPRYHEKFIQGELSEEALQMLVAERNNVAVEYRMF
jgi:hypothetical protein